MMSPILLMYHRVSTLACDPWLLGVTPKHFSEQLELLSNARDVVPLSWLVGELKNGKMPVDVAALTFDDGYADVLLNGKPLLEKHDCPATMFLTTAAIGNEKEFWWDVLARVVLETELLPADLTLEICGRRHSWRLTSERTQPMSQNERGDLLTPPELQFAIWRLLRPLQPDERRLLLEDLAAWAGTNADARECDRSLIPDEVRRLFDPGFIDIGAHTLTHPSLPMLGDAEKQREIAESRRACEELTGGAVPGFSYPFGELDKSSAAAVRTAGFEFACTTVAESISASDDLLRLPRIFVGDWGADEFERKVLRREREMKPT